MFRINWLLFNTVDLCYCFLKQLMWSLNSHFEATGLSNKEIETLLDELEKILLAHLTIRCK